MDRRVSMSDSEPETKAEPKAKASAAKPQQKAKAGPKAKADGVNPELKKSAEPKASKETKKLKRPATAMKRPAAAKKRPSTQAVVDDETASAHGVCDDETSPAGEGPSADDVHDDDGAAEVPVAPDVLAAAAVAGFDDHGDVLPDLGPENEPNGKRKNLRAEDYGLPKAMHIKIGDLTYYNMRYVKKGTVSIRIQETKKVIFTVSQQKLLLSIPCVKSL